MKSGVSLGATYLGENRCRFLVWAPLVDRMEVRILSPRERTVTMEKDRRGYHRASLEGVAPGSLYLYRLEGEKERPDPASRFQPQGVHGPSMVLDPRFPWEDRCWFGLTLRKYVVYELHVGTFTPQGTFEAVVPRLQELKELGITAVELMPVAQFPGDRNWGYDGTYPFAVHNSYGGPEGLKRLVNACHQAGLAVILDVVYNHLGPEGNYLWDFAPYFTDRYSTPWGNAVNFDGAHSEEVRRFFIENALYWLQEFHVDALRLDACHAILDFSARPFLQELAETVQRLQPLNRRAYLIAESDLNDTRLVRSREIGGLGLDAQWSDDFHHALHALLTGEREGYYQDFGRVEHLARAFRDGFVYCGQYSAYRRRRHGNSPAALGADRFLVFAQNHDQVGNRLRGERLSQLVSFEALKLAAGVVLLSPFIPLLFMGEEYGETSPFPYFVSHSDPELIEAVRQGRREEFAAFHWDEAPPDPQEEATFLEARLRWELRRQGHHGLLLAFHQELLRLRREHPALACPSKKCMEVVGLEPQKLLCVRRWQGRYQAMAVFHFGKEERAALVGAPPGPWLKALDSADLKWGGPGSSVPAELVSEEGISLGLAPEAFVVFVREEER